MLFLSSSSKDIGFYLRRPGRYASAFLLHISQKNTILCLNTELCMNRTEKEILFEVAVRIAGDVLDQLELKRKTQLLFQLSEYIRQEEDPTLKSVLNIVSTYIAYVSTKKEL